MYRKFHIDHLKMDSGLIMFQKELENIVLCTEHGFIVVY